MENQTNDPNVEVLLPILKQIPLFSTLDSQLHQAIIQQIVLMYYPANYTLLNEGDQADALYIIKKGQVEIYHPAKEGELDKNVATITESGFFGEMALISEVPRNASARTITDAEIFILSKDHFKQLLDTNTVLAEQISSTVVDRLKENDKQ